MNKKTGIRHYGMAAAAAAGMLLMGCSKREEPQTVHQKPYDIEQAAAMIDEFEWYCAWLQNQETISRENAQALAAHLDSLLPYEGENTVCIQMDMEDWEDESITELTLLHDQNQPLIYHEGVAVVSAQEEYQCEISDGADTCKRHSSTLTIRKEYQGDEPKLKDWYLEYIFSQTEHDGDWMFQCYNGTYNTDASLKLEESFYQKEYDTASFCR